MSTAAAPFADDVSPGRMQLALADPAALEHHEDSTANVALLPAEQVKTFVTDRHRRVRGSLAGARLPWVDISGIDCPCIDLTSADLYGADMRDMDIPGAQLARADARLANFTGTHMVGADLRGADLTGAILEGVDLNGARYDALTRWPTDYPAPANTIRT